MTPTAIFCSKPGEVVAPVALLMLTARLTVPSFRTVAGTGSISQRPFISGAADSSMVYVV